MRANGLVMLSRMGIGRFVKIEVIGWSFGKGISWCSVQLGLITFCSIGS